jgi:hypothetical protein
VLWDTETRADISSGRARVAKWVEVDERVDDARHDAGRIRE